MSRISRAIWKVAGVTAIFAAPVATVSPTSVFAASQPTKPITLSVYLGPLAPTDSQVKSVANPYPQGALYQIAKNYEKLHPNVHIDVLPQVSMTGNNYTNRENTWFASKTEPDIIWVQSEAATIGPEGLLLPLNQYLKKKTPYDSSKSTWQASLLTQGPDRGPQGQEYEIPLNVVSTVFYYNKNILQEAGIHTLPKTLGQFFKDCALIKNAHISGVYPFYETGNPTNWWFYGIYGSAIQGPLVKKSYWHGPKTGALNPEEMSRAVWTHRVTTNSPEIEQVWKWGKELVGYMPPWDPNMTNQQANSLFVNGQLAFYWDGNWDYNALKSAIGSQFKWGTMQLPIVTKSDYPTAKSIPLLGGPNNNVAITASAKRQHVVPWAVNFLQYLSSPSVDSVLNTQGAGGNIPNVKGASVPSDESGFLRSVESSDSTGFFDFGIGPNITAPNVQGVLEAYLNGNLSLSTTLRKAETLWVQEVQTQINQNQHGPKKERWNLKSWK